MKVKKTGPKSGHFWYGEVHGVWSEAAETRSLNIESWCRNKDKTDEKRMMVMMITIYCSTEITYAQNEKKKKVVW